MTNTQIARYVQNFMSIRRQWIERLVESPYDSGAAEHIVKINSKIELLIIMWDWADESVEVPEYYRGK